MVYVVKRVTSPVHRLAEAMQAVVDENFATQVLVESDDEIGYLSQTFNHMSLELQSYFKQIVEKSTSRAENEIRASDQSDRSAFFLQYLKYH